MSVVTSKTSEIRGETRTTTTYHADPNCSQIGLADHAGVGGPADAAWDCDYCCGGAEMDDRPVDGEVDIPRRTYPNGRVDGGRSGVRRNQFGDARRPSDAQERYIRSLLRQLGSDADAWIADATERGVWTKREASRLIDGLKTALAQAGPDPEVADERRTNRYAGECVKCGQHVDAEAGYLAKDASGRWAAEHRGSCPEPQPVVETEPCPEGMHSLDGQIYKVQIAHHGSGLPYAKLLVVHGEGNAEFVYARGAIRNLSAKTLLTIEAAREFGALYGVCCVCAATLTDERSIELGIGPVCGQRVAEWACGKTLTKAQAQMLVELTSGPITSIRGGQLVTARALVRMGLVTFDGVTVRKAVA